MKRIILVAFVLASGFAATAQKATAGLKAGLNIATLSPNNANSWDSKLGYHVGFQVNVNVARSLAIQPELVYSNQGAEYTLSGAEHKLHINYLNVPVLLQYKTGGGLRLHTGPQVGFLTSVNDEVNGTTTNFFDKNDFKKTDVSWAFGLAYVTPGGFGFDARYNLGLTDINEVGGSKLKNNVGQVGVFFELR